MYRLYSWEHSYFSGKARAYLRFKDRQGALPGGFEDILATPELTAGLLTAKTGTHAIPQLETPEGHWVQDTSDIIDHCESANPTCSVIPDVRLAPRQTLATYLVELLGDEWLLVPAFWQRWYFSEAGHDLSHLGFNEQQWGAVIAPGMPAPARRAAAAAFFENGFGISDTRQDPKGVYAGLIHLGCDERTEFAWRDSQHRILQSLEAHFGIHDYLLGGRPSLGDYGLIGPLYAHLYRDAVPGYLMRSYFPVVCEWVERTNGEGALNARQYGQKLYSMGDHNELVSRVATSDDGQWLPNDSLTATMSTVLRPFFDEMLPCLVESAKTLRAYLESDAHTPGDALPGGSFTATLGFPGLQTDGGPLTHAFEIGGIESRRMVVPTQIWMWQRLLEALAPALEDPASRTRLEDWVAEQSSEAQARTLFGLDEFMGGWRVGKDAGRLFSCAPA